MKRRRSCRGVLGTAGAAALVGIAGCASQPSATVRERFETLRAGDVSSKSTNTLVELGIQNTVGPDFEYRLSERIVHTDSTLETSTTSTNQKQLLNQPSLDTTMTFGTLQWIQGVNFFQTDTNSTGSPKSTFLRTNLLEKLDWTPIDLPHVQTWLNRQTADDHTLVDREESIKVFQIEDTIGETFDYMYRLEGQTIQDSRAGVDDDLIEHSLRGTYRDEFLDNQLIGSASVYLEESRATSRVPGDGAATGQVAALAGLADIDTSPEFVMLSSMPALIDGDVNASTGINIGGFASGGETSWNIGVELPLQSGANLAYLYSSEEIDPLYANQFTFSIWTSSDNSFWSPITGSATYTYDRVLRRFRIVMPTIQARYLKIVNSVSPPAAPAVFVTELEVHAPFTVSPGTREIDNNNSKRNLTGALTWRPIDSFSLSYDVFAQKADSELDTETTRDETRLDNGLAMLWNPVSIVDVSMRVEHEDIEDTVRPDQTFDLMSGLVGVEPIDTLDLTLNYTKTKRKVDRNPTLGTTSLLGRTAARLLESLSLEVGLEKNLQEDFENLRDIDHLILTTSLIANLTRSLNLTLGFLDDDATVTGLGAGGIPDPSRTETQMILFYKPSDQLTAEVRLDWRESFAGSGLDQRYRLDWVPFRGGALDLQLNYDRTVVGVLQSAQIDQFLVMARWSFNPRLFLESSYAAQLQSDADRVERATVSLNFSY